MEPTKLNFNISYLTNPTLVLNPQELIDLYMYGVPLCNNKNQELSQDTIAQKIKSTQEWVEGILYLRFNEQIIRENIPFTRTEWNTWGHIKTTFLVKKALQLDGFYNQIKQIGYPAEWLNIRIEQSSLEFDKATLYRQIHIVPSGTTGNATSSGIVYNGVTPFALWLGLSYIPSYWVASYVTGFQKVPMELIDIVGKLAAIQLLTQLGDTYLGVGMSSYSISLDGLSQNTSLIKSGEYGIYGARIKQFMNDIFGDGKTNPGQLDALKAKYRMINFDVA